VVEVWGFRARATTRTITPILIWILRERSDKLRTRKVEGMKERLSTQRATKGKDR